MKIFPKVSIVMAVYRPNIKWLIQQLESLNQQDYEGDMELLVWNDSPDSLDSTECNVLLQKYITNFPFKLLADGRTHGATRAFEKLTELSDGRYIAYCDQDDVWLPGKIRTAVRMMEEHSEYLICHIGISLIDDQGSIFSHLSYPDELSVVNESSYQQRMFILHNFAFGCAMLVRSDFAKGVLPFPGHGVYHDQWIVCCAAYIGRVVFMEEKLILHRIHMDNNSSLLHGISSKHEYYIKKLARDTELVLSLQAWYEAAARSQENEQYAGKGNALSMICRWIEARNAYCHTQDITNLMNLVRSSHVRPDITFFEILLPFMPETVFKKFIAFLQEYGMYARSG